MSNKALQERLHTRQQFQIDRIVFFSDAVIAIAITLMVLEIKIPSFGVNASINQIFSRFGNAMIQHLIALIICFGSIGNLWIRHHELFEHITRYNRRLIVVNLFFLFSIMFLPISISFLFTNNNPQQMKVLVFFLNLFLCNVTFYYLLVVVYNKKNRFSTYPVDEHVKKDKWIALRITITFAVASILVIFNAANWVFYPFIALWLLVRIRDRILLSRKSAKVAA